MTDAIEGYTMIGKDNTENGTAELPATSYDTVPYTSHAFPQSDPRRIAGIARLFGLTTAEPDGARVLEIGCAGGGNLIPLAARHPRGHFVGVDYTRRHIEEGRKRIEMLDLDNVTLLHADISSMADPAEPFDFILCHGVYSWVAPDVQKAILDVCNRFLAPDGVAFVSYNTYPGWKSREVLRDAMLFHTARIDTPAEKLAHARGMIDYMHELTPPDSAFGRMLAQEMPLVKTGADEYIFHDHLEENNRPCYFHEFVTRAQASGLAYLADTTLRTMFVENIAPAMQQRLLNVSNGDQVTLEQYLDFATNRMFRQSLLVKAEAAGRINRRLRAETLQTLAYRSTIVRRQDPTADDQPTLFLNDQGATIATTDRLDRDILIEIARSNASAIDWHTLCARLSDATGRSEDVLGQRLEGLMMSLIQTGLVEVFAGPVAAPGEIGDRPTADPVVRKLAANGSTLVANRLHQSFVLTPVQRVIIPSLDGTATCEALCAELARAVSDGRLTFQHDGRTVDDAAGIGAMAPEILNSALVMTQDAGLLI